MPKTIVSANLNVYGNAGQFETDRSTWGYADTSSTTSVRSGVQKNAGLYSALITKALFTDSLLIPFSFPGTIGKLYLIKAKVFVPSATPIGLDADELTFTASLDNLLFGLTEIEHTNIAVLDAEDGWFDVEISVQATSAPLGVNYEGWLRNEGTGIAGGKVYVDQLEVYEYIGTSDPDPEPEPEPDETDSVFHSKNPITLAKTATPGWDALVNFRLYNDIRVEDEADSSVYNSKLKVELPPDADGNVTFYLNEAFRDAFTLTPPTLNANTIERLTDRIKRFKSFTGELQNTEVTPAVLDESGANLVLFGGIDKFNWPTLAYLTTYLVANKKFLTWAPVEKYVDRLQEDYLNFWVYDAAIATLKLQIKAYYDDDTDETAIATSVSPVAYRSLYQVPAGPVNSGATLINPAKNLVKYELSILDQDDAAISEVRTYYVLAVRKPLTRFFMFLNSLGAFEVLRFDGQAESTTEFGREVVQRFLPHNYAPLDGEFVSNNNVMLPKINYSSGYIKDRLAKAWHEYMQDFLNTSRLYDVTDGRRIPLNIINGNWTYTDQDYERFIRFDVKPAYDNQSFTPNTI